MKGLSWILGIGLCVVLVYTTVISNKGVMSEGDKQSKKIQKEDERTVKQTEKKQPLHMIKVVKVLVEHQQKVEK